MREKNVELVMVTDLLEDRVVVLRELDEAQANIDANRACLGLALITGSKFSDGSPDPVPTSQ
jgi:hypothetical protein